MWEMPFYDIMLLYRAYEDYIKDENENQKMMQEKYEQENPTPSIPNMNDYKMPDFNSISRGMFDAAKSGFNIPGFS